MSQVSSSDVHQAPPVEGPMTMVYDVVLDILSDVMRNRRDSIPLGEESVVELLLLRRCFLESLLSVLYEKISITQADRLPELHRAFVLNPKLGGLVRALCINLSVKVPLMVGLNEVFGPCYGVPGILSAVAPTLTMLVLNTRIHPNIVYAMRTIVFPQLRSLELPHYYLLDVPSTIRIHCRIRQGYRLSKYSGAVGKVERLTEASLVKCWPVLKRLCIRCRWGIPDFEGVSFDLTHLDSVIEMVVVLSDRTWDVNLVYFLLDMKPPASAEVIALVHGSRYHLRHTEYVGLSFHPKLVVPVFGDPAVHRYSGDPELGYLCSLVHIVADRPNKEEFWKSVRDIVASRDVDPEVFHSDCGALVRVN
ncbi:hypothetical protein VNI00_017910 [Paramarasmius palmivorus]|uniref:Uncharacterized protein n=1 Tax=Paramarasmius palmivorus TaxID=297713 RepID=A0AAW0B1W3_9AGAR